jgi:hypothetical protein
LTNIRSEDFVAVPANGLFAHKSGDFFSRFVKKGYSTLAVCCKNTIGNAVKDNVEEFLRFSLFHRQIIPQNHFV